MGCGAGGAGGGAACVTPDDGCVAVALALAVLTAGFGDAAVDALDDGGLAGAELVAAGD